MRQRISDLEDDTGRSLTEKDCRADCGVVRAGSCSPRERSTRNDGRRIEDGPVGRLAMEG